MTDALFTSLLRAASAGANVRRTFVEEFRSSFALSIAVAVTGVLIALAAPPLGIAAAAALPRAARPHPLRVPPLRQHPGHLPPEHPHPLAADRRPRATPRRATPSGWLPSRCGSGASSALSERELLDLEYAALLHDIGQVALVEPIPGGATVLAAPADQRRIEADTVAIVRETGVFEGVARILEHQTTPYRQVRELGEEIPLTSRIIKVVNAYEDLTARCAQRTGARGRRRTDLPRPGLAILDESKAPT